MEGIIIAVLSGGIGAAIATGIMSIIQHKIKRADAKNDAQEHKCWAQTTALRYLMLFIIRWQGTEFLRHPSISWEDRKMMHKWHDLYHDELGGNGDADLLMAAIDKLPLDTEEE